MADIKTDKGIINPNQRSNINFGMHPAGAVVLSVTNEGTTHHCMISPLEAIQMGVMLIQLGGQASIITSRNSMADKANGIPQ